MYLFVYRDFIVGGCELLVEKIGSVLVSYGERVGVLCRTMDPLMGERFSNRKMEIAMLPDWSGLTEEIESFDCQESMNIVTFLWRSFYPCYSAKRRNKRTIFYGVNWEAFTGDLIGVGTLKGKGREYCAGIVERFLKRGNFIAMDDMTIQCAQELYGQAMHVGKEDYEVIYISVDTSGVEPVNREQVIENFKQPHILTISRADFSMKGYLIGLLEWFSKTKEEIYLDIVTYGPDEGTVKKIINGLPADKRNRISLYGKTEYEELDEIIKRSLIYVGMGTTLLDSTERGIISIPVEAFTDKLITSGFFTEHYELLGTFGQGKDFEELVRGVLAMSIDEYLKHSEYGVEVVREHYDLRRNTKRLQVYFSSLPEDETEKGGW